MADRFHRESDEGVDAVLNRMLDAVGGHAAGLATALDVSPETIKTWRRRGEVPMRFLQGFAQAHGLSLDMLRYGESRYPMAQPSAPGIANDSASEFALAPREIAMLRAYRAADDMGRDALERVAAALARGSGPQTVVNGAVQNVAGRDVKNVRVGKVKQRDGGGVG